MGVATLSVTRKPLIYVPSAYRIKIITPVKTVKKRVVKKSSDEEKAAKKPALKKKAVPSKISKNDIRMIEERINYLKAKKKVEEIVKLRSLIDISVQKVVERVEEEMLQKAAQRDEVELPLEEMDTGDVPGILDEYYHTISLQIRKEWVFPEILKGEDFLTVILIRISKNGNVQVLGIEKSSGNSLFDRSVERAIHKASPLKRPPFEMEIGLRFYP